MNLPGQFLRDRRAWRLAVLVGVVLAVLALFTLIRFRPVSGENGFDTSAWEHGISIEILPKPGTAGVDPYEQTNFTVRVRNGNNRPIYVLAIQDDIMCQFEYRRGLSGTEWIESDWLPDCYTDVYPFPARVEIEPGASSDFFFSPGLAMLLGYHRVLFPLYPFDEQHPSCIVRTYPAEPGRLEFEWPATPTFW